MTPRSPAYPIPQLSKMYHPDIADDPNAKEKFQAVNEAYTILGDDRKRCLSNLSPPYYRPLPFYSRAYDKALGDPTMFTRHSQHYGAPYETRRHRGATHAWEYARPSYTAQRQSGTAHHHPGPGFSHPEHTYPRPSSDPFASPYVRNATGKKAPPPHHHRFQYGYRSEADRVGSISSFWRAVQVVGVVLLVATIGGGFGASAA